MVHSKIKYGNVENVVVAEFGKGTLSIANGANKDGYLSLLLKSNKKTPIGDVTGSESSSNEFKPEIALVFYNKESFDVFYKYVLNIKEDFDNAVIETKH